MSVSNNNGRALEARLVEIILQENSSIQPLGSTLNDQLRDLGVSTEFGPYRAVSTFV